MAAAAGTIAHRPAVESMLRPPPEQRGLPEPFPGPSPINHALGAIGVVRGDTHDEYDALGLGRYRSNEKWINASRS